MSTSGCTWATLDQRRSFSSRHHRSFAIGGFAGGWRATQLDNLKSGSGRNILISGKGAGTLDGTQGANVLVGGYTTYDASESALSKLLSEWSRNDADYLTRVNHLRGTTPGGNNLSFVLNTTTVSDNSAVDLLFGGASDDWYLAHTAGGTNDSVTGKSPSEELNTI